MKLMPIVLFFNSLVAFGQGSEVKTCVSQLDSLTKKEVYKIVDQMPTVDGGMQEIFKAVAKQIKYPNNFEGYTVESRRTVCLCGDSAEG